MCFFFFFTLLVQDICKHRPCDTTSKCQCMSWHNHCRELISLNVALDSHLKNANNIIYRNMLPCIHVSSVVSDADFDVCCREPKCWDERIIPATHIQQGFKNIAFRLISTIKIPLAKRSLKFKRHLNHAKCFQTIYKFYWKLTLPNVLNDLLYGSN